MAVQSLLISHPNRAGGICLSCHAMQGFGDSWDIFEPRCNTGYEACPFPAGSCHFLIFKVGWRFWIVSGIKACRGAQVSTCEMKGAHHSDHGKQICGLLPTHYERIKDIEKGSQIVQR